MLWKVEELLRARGIPVEVMGGGGYTRWLKITVELRPIYCDRGNFLVKVHGDLAIALDADDGFPRYYFGPLACADEILAWMRVRKLLPVDD